MEVFVLIGHIDYEGDTVLGVYTTFELAQNAAAVYEREERSYFDTLGIIRQVLDGGAGLTYDDVIYLD